MKIRLTISLIGFAFLLAAVPSVRPEGTGPEALIGRARAIVLFPHVSRDEITKALVDALDASLLVLPKEDRTKQCRSLIEGVKKVMEKGAIFSDKAHEDLGLAYQSVSGGNTWMIPQELTAGGNVDKGIEQSVKICVRLLDSAVAAYKTGRSDEAVRDLLGMVILVVTPIERVR